MSKLINESEKSLSCQSLTNPYIPNSIYCPKNHVILETKIKFQHAHFNLTKLQVMEVAWTFWQVIPFLKLNLNVILNLMLVILFHFLIH